MEQSKNDVNLGRFISLVLRHNPKAAGITLDKNGYADVNELIKGMNAHGKKIDAETLHRIVAENNKQRYSFNDDQTKIRANQGHSIDVDVELKECTPPEFLYHGTAARFLDSIKKEGITKQNRKYVHLSSDIETAISVGKRHGTPAILKINALQMQEDGFTFFISKNEVWLCESVPKKYFTILFT